MLYKPEFVRHDGEAPIFSVDCHPDGTRLATAGGDQKVSLWALGPVKSREVEGDPNVKRKLATLSDHFNTVNCVRFSRNGRWLASGSTVREGAGGEGDALSTRSVGLHRINVFRRSRVKVGVTSGGIHNTRGGGGVCYRVSRHMRGEEKRLA